MKKVMIAIFVLSVGVVNCLDDEEVSKSYVDLEKPHVLDTGTLAKPSVVVKKTSVDTPAQVHTASSTGHGAVKLDFDQYDAQDQAVQAQRAKEDLDLKNSWDKDDVAAQQNRDEEGFLDRAFHAASSDGQADSDIEMSRNKIILERNRQRVFQDFSMRAERIETFKSQYEDFCDKSPWKTVLKLGDMNEFVNMSYKERSDLIDEIKQAVQELDVFEEEDVDPLHDLIRLTMPKATLPDDFKENLRNSVQLDLIRKSNGEKQAVQTQMISSLQSLLDEQLAELTEFNENTKNLKKEINSLSMVKRIKDIAMKSFWAIGVIATVVVLHGPLIVGGFIFGVEAFAVLAKGSFLVYHVGHAREMKQSVQIQTDFSNAFKLLLPKTTDLMETMVYHNKARTVAQRVGEAASSAVGPKATQAVKNAAEKVKQAVSNSVSRAQEYNENSPSFNAIKQGARKLKEGVASTKPAKWIAEKRNKMADATAAKTSDAQFTLATPSQQ